MHVGAVPKVLAHHECLVAHVQWSIFELNLAHVFGSAAVATADVVHGIHLKVKLFHQPETKGCFACSAHVKVANGKGGNLGLVGRANPPSVPGSV
jgi:hypothetical protein